MIDVPTLVTDLVLAMQQQQITIMVTMIKTRHTRIGTNISMSVHLSQGEDKAASAVAVGTVVFTVDGVLTVVTVTSVVTLASVVTKLPLIVTGSDDVTEEVTDDVIDDVSAFAALDDCKLLVVCGRVVVSEHSTRTMSAADTLPPPFCYKHR